MNKLLKNSVQTIMLFLILISLSGCDNKQAHTTLPVAVYVTTISKTDEVEERWFNATVRAKIETDFGFRVGGKIVKRLVNIGDRVTYGQPLAQLDITDYQLAIGIATDQLKAASVDAKQAASDADRFKRLVSDGSIASADLERQKSRLVAAKAHEEQARRALELAQNKNSYATLKAPYSGVITAMSMEVGQVVAEGSPIVSIAKDDEREVVADLPEGIANQVSQFTASAFSFNNNDISVALHLRELSPLATLQTRTYHVRYAPNSSFELASFPLGGTIQLRLSRQLTSGTTVPLNALVKTSREPGVWALNSAGNGVVFVKVNILSYGTNTVIVVGVRDNMRIVTVGAQKLDASMKVRPIERKFEDSENNRGNL
ncbi:putative transport/efflux transmembrane protein [Sulfurovum sp. enrichment culture clone C5]|uniref:Putative transport/efflux transmembrane protein n=1 Tax=Sulfurovum sp. enrichment culture clone C5 TaxID=497650 RepID=A0A0S4XP55_9BACT|nr:putative transport/efflux transmembrane protein [Sulfurovum sp. enrichment culture clone C5]